MQTISNSLMGRIILVFCVLTSACTKTETVTHTVQQPIASFSTHVYANFGFQTEASVAMIDSNFYFRNKSDSGAAITYKWEFGDGDTSSSKNPVHSYRKRGIYRVKLTVSNDNKAFDTTGHELTVVLGQQYVALPNDQSLYGVAIDEMASGEFLMLAASGYSENFHLITLDTLLRQKSKKDLPSSYRLSSMAATKDGNYIFTGTTRSHEKYNEVIKIRPDGSTIWTSQLTSEDTYMDVVSTPDGGYAAIGSRQVTVPNVSSAFYTVVTKIDENGTQQWQKLLDQENLRNTENALIEPDGILLAGTTTSNCMDCDSMAVVKVNYSGQVIWKTAVYAGMNTTNWWGTSIARLANGTLAVTNGYTTGIFIFSASGTFLDRKLAPYQLAGLATADDGDMIMLQTEWSNGRRVNVGKMNYDGFVQWLATPNGNLKLPGGGTMCCMDSYPTSIIKLRSGGTLTLGNTYNSTNNQTMVLLLPLNNNGKQF